MINWGALVKCECYRSTIPGESVTREQNEGLGNDTMYWFKVVVTDGVDKVTSDKCNESTYCKGEYCEGGLYLPHVCWM